MPASLAGTRARDAVLRELDPHVVLLPGGDASSRRDVSRRERGLFERQEGRDSGGAPAREYRNDHTEVPWL